MALEGKSGQSGWRQNWVQRSHLIIAGRVNLRALAPSSEPQFLLLGNSELLCDSCKNRAGCACAMCNQSRPGLASHQRKAWLGPPSPQSKMTIRESARRSRRPLLCPCLSAGDTQNPTEDGGFREKEIQPSERGLNLYRAAFWVDGRN